MEPWSYVSGGKGLLSDESVSAHDAIERGQNGSLGWELRTPCNFESNMVFSSQDAIENQEFAELGFPEMMKKYMSNGSIRDVLGSSDGGGRMFIPITASKYSFSGENESSSNLSSLVVEPTCKDSELIDLKLGRFSDQRDAQDFNSSNTTPILSSAESSIPTKRVRVGGLCSSTPFCQVHGCKKDLSSSKDYHKRHKVCDVHSKTTKVTVNGIEQRFCQQCSRFHLLVEFDDDKRSCRKRLAGHNERRRKTHVSIHSGRNGRLFQSYNGLRFQGTAVTTPSFICQDILPSSLLHPQKYDTNDWCRHIKLEDGVDYSSQSAISIANGQLLHPKSLFPFDFEKQFPPLHDSGVNTTTGRKFYGNGNGCQHDMASSNLFFQNTSIGSENFTGFNSASTAQALSGISDSDRALSLLSPQSLNSSSHSSRIPIAHSSLAQVSEIFLGMSPSASMSRMSNKIHSPGINYVEVSPVDPILISDGNYNVSFGINGMYAKDGFSCEDGPTMDLLQLSTQLQRVEHQRQSLQPKQEHASFCGFRIT